MIYGLEKEALLLSFNKLFLFSQDNHFIGKSQRMTRLGFNDSEEPYVHTVLRSKHIVLFFSVYHLPLKTYCPTCSIPSA